MFNATTLIHDTPAHLLERIVDRFLGSKEAKALAHEEERARLQARALDVQALAALDADELRTITTVHEPACARALAAVRQREAELTIAREQHASAENRRRSAAWDTDCQRSQIRGRLAHSASSLLATWIAALRANAQVDQFHELKSRGLDGHDHPRWSNRDSVLARAVAVRALIQEIENEWPYLPLTDEELQAQYDERIAALPVIETSAPRSLIERLFGQAAS